MGDFTFDVSGLPPWLREQAAGHFETTYNLVFGGLERMTANYFRVPAEECVIQSPPAVAWRELTAQVRSGKPVRLRLAGLGRPDRVRLSELLLQTASRPGRDGDGELARVLRAMWAEFDAVAKVPQDESERAEYAGLEAARREAETSRRENARLRRRVA